MLNNKVAVYYHYFVATKYFQNTLRFVIVSREAKKKQAVHDKQVSYLQVALL